MAKKPKVPLNVLVKEETRGAVKFLAEALECSQGEVVDAAVRLFESQQDGEVPIGSPAVGVEAQIRGRAATGQIINPAEIPGAAQGAQNLPATDPKYLRPNGKPMNFFERKQVDEAEHFAKKAAADKSAAASGRTDVDYEAFSD